MSNLNPGGKGSGVPGLPQGINPEILRAFVERAVQSAQTPEAAKTASELPRIYDTLKGLGVGELNPGDDQRRAANRDPSELAKPADQFANTGFGRDFLQQITFEKRNPVLAQVGKAVGEIQGARLKDIAEATVHDVSFSAQVQLAARMQELKTQFASRREGLSAIQKFARPLKA